MMPPDQDQPESTAEAYDRYAPVYDKSNAQNNYELWLGATLLPELEKHGLRKGSALDIGCGTGRAFEPLLSRGWSVVGCDVSPGMLAEAQRKFGDSIQLIEADARNLRCLYELSEHSLGGFDLIVLLNDIVNYMTEDGDLEQLFGGVQRNLNRDHGLVVFDVNTLALYQEASEALRMEERMDAGDLEWQSLTTEMTPGSIYEARLSGREVETHVHRQRHWTSEQISSALRASSLRLLATLGQQEVGDEILLKDPPEARDPKVIYIAAG